MKTLALVSCGKNKLDHKAPAKELYTGDLFKKARAYVERTCNDWMILSAKHHLVDPEESLDPYELTLNGLPKALLQTWSQKIHEQIKQNWSTDTVIHIYAGRDYRKFLEPLLKVDGYTILVPLQGLGIGEQLSWFKKRQ
jgi:cytoplasmic iron level regulating protein YaaA (DUF328/UPF0246 family)